VRDESLRYRRCVPDNLGSRRLILVGGGARSGKSRFALKRALELGVRRIFIATAEALDDEMTDRISRHRAERGVAFETIEEPLALPEALDATAAADVILVDCLTLWVSNLLGRGGGSREIAVAFDDLKAALERRRCHVILVSNEVGMGLVPETPIGRVFRDVIGDLHQRLAARADEVCVAVMGTIVRLRPAPVEVVWPADPIGRFGGTWT
jgi:adenosylcobinamide kinase / adenosylcobinamide-phosphate guanylyltransferase